MSRMDETDADGEWSDEEVLQSGSQTGLSETEQEDGQRDHAVQIHRHTTPFQGTLPNVRWFSTSPNATMTRASDPVSVMMDKIDAELHAIESEESKTNWPRKFNDRSRSNESSQEHSQTRQTQASMDTVGCSKSLKTPGISENIPSRKPINSILLPDKIDTYTASHDPDAPSDLDPITAREIDARFKEIMSKKKGLSQTDQKKESVLDSPPRRSRRHNQSATTPPRLVTIRESPVDSNAQSQGRELEFLLSRLRAKNACRPSAVMLSTGGYATDNESVRTEDFESKFLSLMVNPAEADRLQQTSAKTIDIDPARRPASGPNPQPGVKIQLSRPRSCSPVRMGLQRYRTTDNSRGVWDSKLGSNKKGSQVFSWDDEFWKQTSRRGPQSVASSFEEVESLCMSKSSSDSMGSAQRHWERMGHGQDPGAWGSKRRFMSRQSSTTSTSTSRSSGLVGDHASADANAEPANQNASIKDTLLESMELLGAHGNLDLSEKIYLEKIFHRVLDWNNGMPVSSSSSSKALDKHFWGSVQQNQASSRFREQHRDTGSPQLHATLRERLEKINQREQPGPKIVLQLPNPAEKKRRRDLIVPDDEESTSSSFTQHKPSIKPDSASTTSSSKDTSRTSKESSVGDASSRYSYISSMSSTSMDNGSLMGSPQGSSVPPSVQNPSLATFLPPTFRLSGSFESTASPPDTYMFNQPYTPSHAERVLMGLGFGATEGFLPERFLRDWYSKIAKAQMEAQLAAQAEIKTPDISENSPTFPMTTPATPDIEIKSTERRDSHVSTASSMLDEAANFFPSNISQDSKNQRLKDYIAAYSNHSNSPTEAREFTLRHFAPTRQKSLPLFLETLSEEEEGRSRISGVDPFDKEARLQMFISDAMSSSGKSTGSNSEKSYISSNQSESDSVSSSSEQHSSKQHRKNQHIKAYNKHLAEERKMENERKENETRAQIEPDEYDAHATVDKRHRHRPKGSPVRQSTVRRNENFDKAASQINPSSGINLIPQSLPVEETPDLNTSSENRSLPTKGATSEKQNSIHSKDSIEVEEIILYHSMKNKSGRPTDDNAEEAKKIKAVEPAMVSIVLEDVDRDASCSDNMLPVSYLGLPASRCSSSSLSPIPQSPVTVIEVGLDNQQDSLDTEGTGSSRETDDDSFPQQTSSSEDATGRKLIRSRSRCSKSYKTPGLGETPRRRNSSASPLPLSKSRLSPSGEFDQMKPRRRLSLEVPITPEVRYMLERQRAYSIGQLSDDTQLSRATEAERQPNSGRERKKTVLTQPGNGTYQSTSPMVSLDKLADRRARSVSPTPKTRDILSTQMDSTASGNASPLVNSYATKSDRAANISAPVISNSSLTDEKIKQIHQTEMNDFKTMRFALTKTRQDLTEIEHTLLDTREMSEDAKSGLMMLEFQRGNVSKDLERLNEDVIRKQGQVSALDSELQVKLEDLKTMASMSVTKEECLEVKTLKEENWNLKNRLRSLDSLQAERDELVSQLDAANQELFRQQKHNRLQTVEVQEEMESLTSKVEEIQNGWAEDQDQLSKLQQAYRRMEMEKNELIKGKAKEYEKMKAALRDEVTDIQQRMGKELGELGKEVTELRLQVSQLSADNATKDTQLKNAREQVDGLQSSVAVEKQERSKAANDYRTALNNLKREMSSAVSKMKDSIFLEKQKALEDMKREFQQENSDLTASHENKLQLMMEQHSYQLAEKDSEISNLQDVLRRQENQIQSEIDLQVHEAIVRERTLIEQETEWQVRKEREEGNRRITELMVQCEQERQASRDFLSEIGSLKKELEEQRRLQRDASKEKLLAVSKAKEQMKQQNQAEIERIKFNINQEHENEFDQLREQIRMKEDEATKLCLEKQAAIEREKQILQILEQTERLVISELNEECQKVSRLLGITVHNLGQTNHKPDFSESRHNITSRTIPIISSALANLRDCNERLVSYVNELDSELDSLKAMVDNVMKEKDEAVENCTIEMERQKTLELETLKEKLLQDHVHEMSRVIQECASTNSQLRTNSEHIQRYGDAALLEALQAKDDELFSVEQTMAQWKSDLEETFNVQLQLLMAKEREKYQALQHHRTREQSRINELQRKEIERLENEVEKLSLSQTKPCNRIQRAPSPASSIGQMSDSLSVPLSNPLSPGNLKSSQQYLQARIQQLQADNAALRKQRLLASRQLGSSTNSLRASSPKGQTRVSSSRDPDELHWLSDKFKQGEKEAIKVNEQAKLNQKILNNKMDEMARLQNTLISQNQELQELERAYNDLHKHYNSRPSSPTMNLNVTI